MRREFENETTSMWRDSHNSKHTGRIFQKDARHLGPDMLRSFRRIDAEINAAVEKHGPAVLPDGNHVDKWYKRVSDERDNIVARSPA